MSSFGQFSWGFQPKIEAFPPSEAATAATATTTSQQAHQTHHLQSTATAVNIAPKQKRRLSDPQDRCQKLSPQTPRRKFVQQKKSRSVRRIIGQPLPTNRVIEVLDRQKLQELLNNLVNLHPEISADIYKAAPRPTVQNAIAILAQKISNIQESLPYNVDSSSEYAYLRVKPLIEDFLNALSDYTLQFLPPVETQPAASLDFLDHATSLLHQLPTFASLAHNYFKHLAYEQIGHTWCVALKEFTKQKGLVMMGENWELKVKKHNEMCGGKLKQVVEFMKEEKEVLEQEMSESPSKLAALQNFSVNNSPYGFKQNLGV